MDNEGLNKKEQPYANVYEWDELSNAEYPVHQHEGKVALLILFGSVEILFVEENSIVALSQGDFFKVPAKVDHSVQFGPEGCTMLVGEEIEGDSDN